MPHTHFSTAAPPAPPGWGGGGPAAAQAQSCSAGGLRWRVWRGGAPAGQAPGLLLLHGTGSSWRSWQACLPGLARHFHLVVPDLPGHAGSQGFADHRASLPRMATALGELLRSLAWQPQLVAGHSAGAAVMAQLCLDGHTPQVRGLLAVNGALQPLPGLLGAVAPAVAAWAADSTWLPRWVGRHAAQPRALDHLINATGSQLPAAAVAHYRALLQQPEHLRGVLDMLAHWRLEPLQARLPQLQARLWLAAGLADRTVPPEQARALAAKLPQAQFHSWPGLGHLAQEEAPETVNALLMALWASVSDAPSA